MRKKHMKIWCIKLMLFKNFLCYNHELYFSNTTSVLQFFYRFLTELATYITEIARKNYFVVDKRLC